jgi:hypothetical protein
MHAICNEIRQHREPVVINNVAEDEVYCGHQRPAMYGFQSYLSIPICLPDGSFFGTLCALVPCLFSMLRCGLLERLCFCPSQRFLTRHDDLDADLDRLEHEQGTTAELWSGDRGAELERLELDPETRGERGRSEPPERGIEDDEELER